jgi:hypothetical protein
MTPVPDRLESRQLLSTAMPGLRGVAITTAPAEILVHPELRTGAPHRRHGASDPALVHPVVWHRASGLGPGATSPGPNSVVSIATSMPIALSGSVHGATQMQGSETGLDGSGTVNSLGAVTSRGMLTTSGAEPVTYSGTITLAGSTGSVTATLSGRLFGPTRFGQPIALTYTITGGTGAFQGAFGSGQASFILNFSGAGASFVLTFGNATNPLL